MERRRKAPRPRPARKAPRPRPASPLSVAAAAAAAAEVGTCHTIHLTCVLYGECKAISLLMQYAPSLC